MANQILNKILEHSKKTKRIIGVRKYDEGDTFYVGYIVDYNDILIVLQEISMLGLEDGLLVEKIENIESFETEDEYLKSYQLLFGNTKNIYKQTVKSIKISKKENWQYEILKNKYDKGKIIAIELNNENVIIYGFITEFDEVYLSLTPISNLGLVEGKSIYKLADITSFSIDNIESRKRGVLKELRKNNT